MLVYDLNIGDGCHLQLALTAKVMQADAGGQRGVFFFNELHVMAGGEVSPVLEATGMYNNITIQVNY